ncbi:MAG: cytochrome c3 family protein [Kofleriaceae bacterium]
MRVAAAFVALAIATIAVVLGARAIAHDDGTAWSPIVYPEQRLPLIFSHRTHLAKGATCVMCHPAAMTSRSAVDNLIPTEMECRACHPIDRADPEKVVAGAPTAKCVACHPGWTPNGAVARVYLTPTPLKFDHAAHTKTPCTQCHGDMTKVDLATTRQLPTMASCLTCHTNGAQERHCSDCHVTKPGGAIQTEFPHGTLIPRNTGMGDAHAIGFAKNHAQEARQIGATCTACHDRSECVACHQGVTKPLEFHAGNYLLTHAVEAKRGTPDCSACHRAQSFCVACHERSGLSPRVSHELSSPSQPRMFHPANFDTRHGPEARRNITSCASCHREDDCMKCHSNQMGSMRASPHPPNWRNSARCEALDRGNRRACLRCHVTRDEIGCNWSAP